jgi:hypothetical protein
MTQRKRTHKFRGRKSRGLVRPCVQNDSSAISCSKLTSWREDAQSSEKKISSSETHGGRAHHHSTLYGETGKEAHPSRKLRGKTRHVQPPQAHHARCAIAVRLRHGERRGGRAGGVSREPGERGEKQATCHVRDEFLRPFGPPFLRFTLFAPFSLS